MFDSSKKKFSAEQSTANATGLGSVAFGKSGFNLRQSRIFGAKTISTNNFTKPVITVVIGLVLIVFLNKRAGR